MLKSRIDTIIWVMMYATLLLTFFGNYFIAPGVIKLLYSIAIWFCLLNFPIIKIKRNDFNKYANIILKSLGILVALAVLHSVFGETNVHIGNKWVTLFGNPECIFMMLAPLFAYLGTTDNCLLVLKRAMQVFLLVGMMGLLVSELIPQKILWFSIIFFPYVHKKYRILILISIGMAFFSAFLAEDTSRTQILIIGYILAVCFFVYKFNNRKIIKIFCILSVVIPITYALLTLLFPEFSAFTIVLDSVMQGSGNSELALDTRTFLFKEMSEDLTNNDSWWFGKGAYSFYYSDYFASLTDGSGDHYQRITCEVTLLQALLRGGVAYAIVYFGVIICAILCAINKAQNKLLLSVAIMASGWVCVACMSSLNGFEFMHIGFFILIGCCFSEKWQNMTDQDIINNLKRL